LPWSLYLLILNIIQIPNIVRYRVCPLIDRLFLFY
jgi:hypothetical protein